MDRRESRVPRRRQRASRGPLLLLALIVLLVTAWSAERRLRPGAEDMVARPRVERPGERTGERPAPEPAPGVARVEVGTRKGVSPGPAAAVPAECSGPGALATGAAPRTTLKIRALDASGEPLGAAQVEIGHAPHPEEAERLVRRSTGPGGVLELGLEPGSVRVVAWTEDAVGGPVGLDLTGGQEEIEISLRPSHAVAGRVVDQLTGTAVADAAVTFWTFSESDQVRTEADGTFRHPRFPAGETVQQVRVTAPGYGPTVRFLRVDQDGSWELPAAVGEASSLSGTGSPWIELALPPELRIRGTVEDPEGRPIERAEVTAEGFYHALPRVASRDAAEARTLYDGAFHLEGLRSDIGHAVLVRAPGFAERVIEVPPDPQGERNLGLLRLEPEALLVGVVVDPDGHPVEDIEVVLAPRESEDALPAAAGSGGGGLDVEVRVSGTQARARTGADGTFLFEHLDERPYELRVQRDGEALLTLELEPVPGQRLPALELGLPFHTVTMTGTVTGPEGPVAGARVELRRFGHVAAVLTDAGGRFRVAGLDDVEPYSLRARAVCPRSGRALRANAEAWGFEAPVLTVSSR